jgi:membrane protein YqaA with SNARE-associated domain
MDKGASAADTKTPAKPPSHTLPKPQGRVPGTRDGVPRLWWRVVALLFALTISVLVFLYRDRVAEFGSYGYLGLFIVSIVGNATVLLPVPSLVATFITGGILNPLLVGIVSGAGMAVGELTGYLAGYGGGAIIAAEDQERYQRLESWMRRYGAVTLFVLSAIPNPLFDLAGIAAGALHYPLWRFLLVCFLGKTLKGLVLAFAGSRSLDWINRFLH